MRDYGKVHTSYWTSQTIRDMSEDGRSLAMYLLTCPHGTISGVFRLPDGYACEDLQWEAERVQKGFVELLENGFANRCETSKWVWILKHFEFNQPENPNQKKSAAKVALQIPASCAWKPEFMREYADFLGIEYKEIETVSEPLRNPSLINSSNRSSTQEQEQYVDAPPASPPARPKKEPADENESALQAACRETFKSYSLAYWDRYQTDPVINAKIRSQVKQFCQRIPYVEAPMVAGYYVGNQAAYYVRKGHDVGSMLADAEKLRTEWATNRQVTDTQARQLDRSQSNFSAADEAMRILEAAGVA